MYADHMLGNRPEEGALHKLKSIPGFITSLSNFAWRAFQAINTRLPQGELPHPKWAPGKILKSYERSAPPLGIPRETDSLCPKCVPEVRNAIIRGELDVNGLVSQNPG